MLFGDLALLVSECIINKLMPFTFTWAAGGGGTRGLVLLDSPEVKNFNKIIVKIAQQDGGLLQGNQHLANQVKLQLPGDEVSDQTVAMTVIEAMPHYDQLL